jgi:hypothetical protein
MGKHLGDIVLRAEKSMTTLIATCQGCGHKYKLLPQQAGKTLKCKICGGVVHAPGMPGGGAPVPASAAPQPTPPRVEASDDTYDMTASPEPAPRPIPRAMPAPVSYQSRQSQAPEISKDRLRAGRICIILSILGYLAGFCIGAAGILLLGVGAAGARGGAGAGGGPLGPGGPGAAGILAIMGGVVFVIAGFLLVVSTTYLVCGINIRKGGFISAVVALIVASLHLLLLLAGLAFNLFQMANPGAGREPPGPVAMIIQLLYTAAIAQLVYLLVKVLREPRT